MDAQEAFETLLCQLRQALQETQEAGARAFRDGRFEEARSEAKRGEDIAARIQQLEQLQREWSRLLQDSDVVPTPARRKHLPRGQRTPQDDFVLPILIALEEMGGRGEMREVLDRVGQIMQDQLREVDWQLLSDGRSIRWRNTAQWARRGMVEKGLLASNSPHGVWEITDAGRAYLREHRTP